MTKAWQSDASSVVGGIVALVTLLASAPGIDLLQHFHVPQDVIDVLLIIGGVLVTPKNSGKSPALTQGTHVPATPGKAYAHMANLIDTLLSEALTVAVTEAEAYKPQILAAAAAANVSLETAVDNFIGSIKAGGALGLILPSLKGAIISAVNQEISKNAVTEETALFNLIVATAQNEAKKLAAA